jgi:hypothetical protein
MRYDDFVEFFHQSVDEFNDVIGTSNPDLSRFREAGGKIVGWVGTYDQADLPAGLDRLLPASDSRTGRPPEDPPVLPVLRGSGSCTLRRWCRGSARQPARGARRLGREQQTTTGADGCQERQQRQRSDDRPVCPYGENAVYKGHGDTNDKKSFVCKPDAAGFHP